MAARPRPLKIVAAEPPGDIDDFADKVESRDAARLHRFRRELAGVDAADGDLRFRVTFRPGESQRPVMRKMGEGRQLALFGMANRPRWSMPRAPCFGEPPRPDALEERRKRCASFARGKQ